FWTCIINVSTSRIAILLPTNNNSSSGRIWLNCVTTSPSVNTSESFVHKTLHAASSICIQRDNQVVCLSDTLVCSINPSTNSSTFEWTKCVSIAEGSRYC